MAAAFIHESSRLNFGLNSGTVSEPKKTSVSISRLKESVTADALANVAQAVDATFDLDVLSHSVVKTYALDLG